MRTGISRTQGVLLLLLIGHLLLLSVACDRKERPDILALAKRIANTRFKGYTYGDQLDKKQINCVQFVAAVVEELLHRKLTKEEYAAIYMSYEFENLDNAVSKEDDRTRGIQRCLVDVLGVAETIQRDNAAPGDFVQYWYKTSEGHWCGHVAIVNTVWQDNAGNSRVSLFGSHKSSNGIAVASFNGGLVLDDTKKVYMCRLTRISDESDNPRPQKN